MVPSNLACNNHGKYYISPTKPTTPPAPVSSCALNNIDEAPMGRIYNGIDAPSGSYPFYVAIRGESYKTVINNQLIFSSVSASNGYSFGGILVGSQYVLSHNDLANDGAKVAYGLKPGDDYSNVFDSSNPNLVEISTKATFGNGEVALFQIPPITFDEFTQPAQLSDCSGPSGPIVGDQLAIFGLGEYSASEGGSDTVQGKCIDVVENSANCTSSAAAMGSNYFCANSDFCYNDRGGPLVATKNGVHYAVSVIEYTESYCIRKPSL